MSLLAAPEKRGNIDFVVAKSMPYGMRLGIVFLSLVSGMVIQLLFSFYAGSAIFAIGVLFSAVWGYRARPNILRGTEKWERVTPDEYAKIKAKAKALEKWDEDFFDITSKRGVAGFVMAMIFFAILYFILAANFRGLNFKYFAVDFALLVGVQWISGSLP